MVDGSITINTKIDQTGFKSGVSGVKRGLNTLQSSLKNFASMVGTAFAVTAIVNFTKESVSAANELSNALTGLQSIVEGTGNSFSQAQSFIEEYTSDGLIPMANAVTAYKNLLARGYTTDQIEETLTDLKDSAAFGRQSSYTMGEAVQTATEGLKNENSILVDNAGVTKNVAKMWEDYADSIGVSTDSLTTQQKIQAEVNGIMEETKWQTGDAAKLTQTFSGQVSQLSAQITNLKTAMGNAIIPILKAALPYVTQMVQELTVFADRIKYVTEKIFGSTTAADSINETADAIESLSDATDDAAESADKTTASFDTLNKLSSSDDSTSSSIDSTTTSGTGADSLSGDETSDEIEKSFNKVALVVSGFLLALGAILTFSGVAPMLGIALMAAGAVGLATEMAINWDTIVNALQGPIGILTSILSAAVLVLGAMLAFTGVNIVLGIALMAAGAAGLATVIAVNWNTIVSALQGPVGVITELVSTALLVIGAMLAFTGVNIVLGIALIAVGAVGLATVIAVNWGAISDALQGPVGDVTALLSGVLLVLGAALAFSGVNLPLGIALMAAGAVGLVSVVAANWDTVSNALQGPMGAVTAIAGGALLALGVILLFTGAGIPLGLGLILLGAASLGTAIAANWDTIKSKIKPVLADILAIASTASIAIGLLLCLTGVGIPLGIGLILAGVAGTKAASSISTTPITTWAKNAVNSIIGIFESGINFIVRMLNTLSFDIPDWVPGIGGGTFGFNLSPVNIPRLATGAVIPPNREFLAVLGDQKSGTNIEAPEGLIRSVVSEEVGKAMNNFPVTDTNIKFTGSLSQLARVLYPVIEKEKHRTTVFTD